MTIFDGTFDEPTEKYPDKIFTEVTKDFSTLTEGLAELSLLEVSGVERVTVSVLRSKRFRFKVILRSTYLSGYSFVVLEFGYDISVFPVSIAIEEGIYDELEIGMPLDDNFEPSYIAVDCKTETEFEQKLKVIFATSRFKKTVGGVMKIARIKQEEDIARIKREENTDFI
ncbi:MAG: hypothetical protein GQ582_04175 [Methyloprofundus sp.]|nr:hypothetical protein [Methyloprofundus sp.]